MTELRESTAASYRESQTIARMNTAQPHLGAPADFRTEGNSGDPGYEPNKPAGRSVEVELMLARANEDAVRKTAQVRQVRQSIAETIAGRESNSAEISSCPRGMIASGLAKSLTRTLANLS